MDDQHKGDDDDDDPSATAEDQDESYHMPGGIQMIIMEQLISQLQKPISGDQQGIATSLSDWDRISMTFEKRGSIV